MVAFPEEVLRARRHRGQQATRQERAADLARGAGGGEADRPACSTIERGINGKPTEQRLAARQQLSAPVLADLKGWMQAERKKLSRHSPVAKAMDYMLRRWDRFARFLDDGRICLTNNAAERALRGIALGRKSWLFCGSDRGGVRAAAMYTLIGTAKLNNVDPQAWLADVLGKIAGTAAEPARRTPSVELARQPAARSGCIGQGPRLALLTGNTPPPNSARNTPRSSADAYGFVGQSGMLAGASEAGSPRRGTRGYDPLLYPDARRRRLAAKPAQSRTGNGTLFRGAVRGKEHGIPPEGGGEPQADRTKRVAGKGRTGPHRAGPIEKVQSRLNRVFLADSVRDAGRGKRYPVDFVLSGEAARSLSPEARSALSIPRIWRGYPADRQCGRTEPLGGTAVVSGSIASFAPLKRLIVAVAGWRPVASIAMTATVAVNGGCTAQRSILNDLPKCISSSIGLKVSCKSRCPREPVENIHASYRCPKGTIFWAIRRWRSEAQIRSSSDRASTKGDDRHGLTERKLP